MHTPGVPARMKRDFRQRSANKSQPRETCPSQRPGARFVHAVCEPAIQLGAISSALVGPYAPMSSSTIGPHRGTSLIGNSTPLGPHGRTMPRALL